MRPAPKQAPGPFVLAVVADESDPMYYAGTVPGPATVLLRQPARITVRGRAIHLQQLEDRPMSRARELVLSARQELIIG
jgi:hypothetical protein